MKWIDRPTGEQPLLKKDNALKTYPLGGLEKVYSPPLSPLGLPKICTPSPILAPPHEMRGCYCARNPTFPLLSDTYKAWTIK